MNASLTASFHSLFHRHLAIDTSRRYQPTGRGVGRPRIEEPCTVADCGRPHFSKGLCRRHYDRQWRRRRAAA